MIPDIGCGILDSKEWYPLPLQQVELLIENELNVCGMYRLFKCKQARKTGPVI